MISRDFKTNKSILVPTRTSNSDSYSKYPNIFKCLDLIIFQLHKIENEFEKMNFCSHQMPPALIAPKRTLDLDDESDSCWQPKRPKSASTIELSELSLWKLANRHENLLQWKNLAAELGLKKSEIQEIESKFKLKDGLVECLYQVLLKWRLKSPDRCSIKYLESKLDLELFDETKCEKMMSAYEKLFLENEAKLESIELNEKILWEISDNVCAEWKSIGRYLGLKESDIYEIEIKDGLRECCYQALLKWWHQTNDHHLKYLCLSLIKQSFNYYYLFYPYLKPSIR
ncbi:hypothetical protein BpHYR1_016507 [Brachionus plicatilis]|uniref:Death domain-containing protein n=1 Tax=Brachionus plicatilis TaxID=10195 RepID=A0A3M7R7S5_BRAPC|nr:hypothetical protein BpHYR1_016507 [Brachionus plicatilis]